MKQNFSELGLALRGISSYKHLMYEPLMCEVMDLIDGIVSGESTLALEGYTNIFYLLREGGYLGIGAWLQDKLCYTPSHFAKLVDEGGEDPALENCAIREIETLLRLARIDCDLFIQEMAKGLDEQYHGVLQNLPRWQGHADFDADSMVAFYRAHGYGLFAQHRGFLWTADGLVPVKHLDSPNPAQMLGYTIQRNQVIENTKNLVAGKPAQNILLFGDGGTGKSAAVKSLLSHEGMEWLRIIQVDKNEIATLPHLIEKLNSGRLKFVLFIDDLAFDQDDNTYSTLKTILEGGLQQRPQNVVVYATSNRRHLVRQTISERAGDEVDTAETISEKTALAERFGLRIPYLTMNKADYLALVEHLDGGASGLSREVLHQKAMMWEIRHGGRTPRVTRQFIASLQK